MNPEWEKALFKKNFIPIFDKPFISGMKMTEFLTKTKRMSKIETILEYQGLAARTCPDLGTPDLNERHMNLGVVTEIGETLDIFKKFLAYQKPIDIVNLGEELADTAWYIVNKCRFHEVPLDDNFDTVVAEISTIIKEGMFTEAELPLELKSEALLTVILMTYCGPTNNMFNAPIVQLAVLANIAQFYELDFFQLLTNNIDKLKVRYPEKFTNEAAQNRDLEAERAELEK
jgi:NTP pyrophosphatase (non-canonical NTP hydrolase)